MKTEEKKIKVNFESFAEARRIIQALNPMLGHRYVSTSCEGSGEAVITYGIEPPFFMVDSPEQMQAQLDKSGAILLNGPKGRVVVLRSRIEAIAEVEEDGIVRIFYKGSSVDDCYNIKASFDEVVKKIYG